MEEALGNGAKQLTADEIAGRLVGNTGTWVAPSGDKKIAIHYGEDNVLTGKLLGGDWSGKGYYGSVTKFNAADGSLNGHYEKIEDGKAF